MTITITNTSLPAPIVPDTYLPIEVPHHGLCIWISAHETIACVARAYGLIKDTFAYKMRVYNAVTVSTSHYGPPQYVTDTTTIDNPQYNWITNTTTTTMTTGTVINGHEVVQNPPKYTIVNICLISHAMYDAIMKSHVLWVHELDSLSSDEVYYQILLGAGLIDAIAFPCYTVPKLFQSTEQQST